MAEDIKTEEAFLKIGYERGWNMGKFGDIKKYTIEISGNQGVVEDQIKNHRKRLQKYIQEVEGLIEDAHKYNIEKAKAEQVIAETTQDNK